MDTDSTTPSCDPHDEPTQPATCKNPYELNPYGNRPSIPPPPPQPHNQKGLIIALMSIICLLVLILVGMVSFRLPSPSQQSEPTPIAHSTDIVPSPTAMAHSPTPTLLTPTPTANPNYTAVDLMNAFNDAGIYPKYVEYNKTIWNWTGGAYYVSVHATSSVHWTDNAGCPGNCEPANLGLWVYNDVATAKQAYTEVVNDGNQIRLTPPTGPTIGPGIPYVHGRCLLLGAMADNSIYKYVVTHNCI